MDDHDQNQDQDDRDRDDLPPDDPGQPPPQADRQPDAQLGRQQPPNTSTAPIPDPNRPKRGRPRKIVKPVQKKPAFDPSQPLKNEKFERLCQLKLAGESHAAAYKIVNNRRIKTTSANQRASKILSIPDVRARLQWLMVQEKKAGKAAKIDNKPDNKPAQVDHAPPKPPAPASGTLDRDEIASRITDAVRNAESSLEISTAIKTALQAIPELATPTADAEPDPAQIAAHVARFAGAPLADMVGDDPSFVVDRLAKAAGMTLDQLADAIQGKRHTLTAPTPHFDDLPD